MIGRKLAIAVTPSGCDCSRPPAHSRKDVYQRVLANLTCCAAAAEELSNPIVNEMAPMRLQCGELQPMLPLFDRVRREIAPGAVHIPSWLELARQKSLTEACRQWAVGPAPMRHTRLASGGVMSVQTVCLGWHWLPYRYSRTADDVDGAPVKPLPEWLAQLGRRAVLDAYGDAHLAAAYAPDAALVNFYDAAARLGMHQDREERSAEPVVSLSLGDTCVFRFGNTANRGKPYTDLELVSGDLFVFGGASRFAYHGVPKVYPGTADPDLGVTGRLNITLRVTGLSDPPRPAGPDHDKA